jgi:hypothetical protein
MPTDQLPAHLLAHVCLLNKFRLLRLNFFTGLFGMTSASKSNLTKQLKTGHCCIYIGGMAELFLASPTEEKLFLKQRKGFVKLALRTGSEIVPIYYFGNSSALKVRTFVRLCWPCLCY